MSIKRSAGSVVRHLLHSTYDAVDRRLGTLSPLTPPRELNPNLGFTPRRTAYPREFGASGDRVADMLVSYAALQPFHSVLDIGCGIGRVARPLAGILSTAGHYQGFDVDADAIAWCQTAYRGFDNFSFTHAPVGYVNVRGGATVRGEEYVFPCGDATVDLAFSISVYTHLPRATIAHYLAETARVLRPGGMCVNTFFVIDDFAATAMREGRADRSYVEQDDGSYLSGAGDPGFGIGFTPAVIEALHESSALTISSPPRYGTWSGRDVDSYVYQDVVIAQRPPGSPR